MTDSKSNSEREIRLRPLRAEDAPAMLAWMNDGESVKYLGSGFARPRSLEDVREYIELRLDGEFTGECFAVADAHTDEYLGQCDLMLPDARAGTAEAAIVLLPDKRGRGTAAQALRLLVKKAFGELGYRRLYLKCASENASAVRLYERAGFVREGTLRQHIFADSKLMDVYIYGLLKT
ncbi:MAG: GNAT family N-acetyltransferase [Clostridia bacterium]|nr:GNAT family N-acetyltransferase [Clostridia bacterium]